MYPLSSAAVVARKGSSASTSSAASSGLRRPASVVIHDEELVRLADELLSQEMALEGHPKPSSSPATNLVRRNSSGYSSSGSRDRLSKTPQSASKWPPPPPVSTAKVPKSATNGPAPRPPQSPVRSRSYKGATSTVLNRVRAAESSLRRIRQSRTCHLHFISSLGNSCHFEMTDGCIKLLSFAIGFVQRWHLK